jgi:hypothetical protein
LKNDSFDVPAADQYERDRAQSGQVRFDDSDQSEPFHPDWRESSGIALPTVEELHYAHHFLIRAAERRLNEVLPATALLHTNPRSHSPLGRYRN